MFPACSLLLMVPVKKLLIKMFGRKAAEVAMEERCIMADAVTHILHQVELAFLLVAGGIQRRVDFTRYLVVACFVVLLHGLTQLAPALR